MCIPRPGSSTSNPVEARLRRDDRRCLPPVQLVRGAGVPALDEEALNVSVRLIGSIWDRVVRVLGIHTALVLAERALWMTHERHDEASRISISEGGVSFAGLYNALLPAQAGAVAEDMLKSLASLITRLLGVEMSRTVAEELDQMLKDPQEAANGTHQDGNQRA